MRLKRRVREPKSVCSPRAGVDGDGDRAWEGGARMKRMWQPEGSLRRWRVERDEDWGRPREEDSEEKSVWRMVSLAWT